MPDVLLRSEESDGVVSIVEGGLHLTPRGPGLNLPIDRFLTALAEDLGPLGDLHEERLLGLFARLEVGGVDRLRLVRHGHAAARAGRLRPTVGGSHAGRPRFGERLLGSDDGTGQPIASGVMSMPPHVVHPEKCSGCDLCGMYCPDFAIFGTKIPAICPGKEKEDSR